MANFTKQAIKTSFIKLLNEQPLNKISVRSIVEAAASTATPFTITIATFRTLSKRS